MVGLIVPAADRRRPVWVNGFSDAARPAGPERLDALVVAVHRLPAVVDRGDATVLVAQDHDRGVDVAGLADRRIDAHRGLRIDVDDLAAGHETSHVEVVDHHVEEDATGHLDVLDRRRRRVATGDAQHVQVADGAVDDCGTHGRVRGVESPVEPDLDRDATAVDDRQRLVDLVEIERDRLLAQDRLAGLGGGDQQRHMCVGAAADRDSVDIGRRRALSSTSVVNGTSNCSPTLAAASALMSCTIASGCAGDTTGDQLGVHLADSADAEYCDPESHCGVSCSEGFGSVAGAEDGLVVVDDVAGQHPGLVARGRRRRPWRPRVA